MAAPVEANALTFQQSVCAVMSELKRLKKADRNEFAKYDFTSVDDFKDALRPLMARHGLYIHVTVSKFEMLETVDDKGKVKPVAHFDFAITLCHSSGCSRDPEIMPVILPFVGAQTSGIARSYALKEWLKSSFMASAGESGDMDAEADIMAQSKEGLRLSKAEARDTYEKLQSELRDKAQMRDSKAIADWMHEEKYRLDALPKDWYMTIHKDAEDAYRSAKQQERLDEKSEDEPDEAGELLEKAELWFSKPKEQIGLDAAFDEFRKLHRDELDDDNWSLVVNIYEQHETRLNEAAEPNPLMAG